jgi:large subunit ribosomal protein LP2
MKYIAAYALLVLGGKTEPAVADVEKVLKEAGIKADTDHAERLVSALKGRPFHELVSAGKAKMSTMGTVVAAPGAGAQASAAPAQAAKEEEKPKEEEADVDMGGLFGDDY